MAAIPRRASILPSFQPASAMNVPVVLQDLMTEEFVTDICFERNITKMKIKIQDLRRNLRLAQFLLRHHTGVVPGRPRPDGWTWKQILNF
jgi:hypothetical protein